jgi:hypothetical protein
MSSKKQKNKSQTAARPAGKEKDKSVSNRPAAKRPSNTKSNAIGWYIGLAIVLVMIILIRINFLEIPFERDEGSYAYAGKIILNGAVPFTDIGSQRLDGVFYAYAIVVAIFGYTLKSLHIAFLVINLASTTMLFFLTRKMMGNIGGFAAAIFFALLSMSAFAGGFTIQSEHLVVFSVIGAMLSLFYFFEKKKVWSLILAGILFSIAFQIKQTSVFYGLFAGMLLLYKEYFVDRSGIKKLLLYASIFSAAVLFPILVDLFVIYQKGAWHDFHLWFFEIRKQYSSFIRFDRGVELFKGMFSAIFTDYKFFWIISFIGSISIFFTSLSLWKKIAVAGFNVAGFITVVPGYHFYGHYFLQWIPAVSISAAAFIFSIYDILQNRFRLKVLAFIISMGTIVIAVVLNLKDLNEYYFNPDYTRLLKTVYGENPFPESKVIADKLNTMMKPEDKLAVFGTEIQMYVYTNKKSPSRFAGSGALLEFPTAQNKAWQQEFMSDVEKAAPKFLVFFNHPYSWMVSSKTENLIFPWFDNFAKNYKTIGFAEMNENGTKYVWEPNVDMTNHPPKSQFTVYVFERK